MNTTKKTAFGILGVAATAALVAGASVPAMADDHDSSTSATHTMTEILRTLDLSNASPIVIAPQVGTGDILGGDILSNNGNGNQVGNDNVVGSGNDTTVGSGNTTGIDGVDIDASDLFDSTVGNITGEVSGLLDDVDLMLNNLFEN